MAIHVALNHRTHYTYDRWVSLSPQVIRLRPAPHCRTPVLSYSLKVLPRAHFINWQQDPQSNYLARVTFPEKTKEFLVEVDLVAEMAVYNPFDFFLEPDAEKFPFTYEAALKKELTPFLEKLPLTRSFGVFVNTINRDPVRTIDFLVGLNQRLSREIKYIIRLEPGVQTPEETLASRSGSCRDSAWLLVQLFRHVGLAARFASGYLIQLKADVKSLDGPSGTDLDFTDLHAWCEVYLPGAGWVGLDPTSGLMAGEGHLPLAATPDPSSAAPVSGAVDACEVKMVHEMKVTRIYESPRVTKPYSDEQWKAIESLGHQIDSDLVKHDVRLTMGGEPTFISIDNMDGQEWNFTAVSEAKRELSTQLLHRLKTHFAPGGLPHFGFGKWYPGESLPRWALGCYWRRDGVPIWNNEGLLADEQKDYGFGEKQALQFAKTLAEELGISVDHIQPGYEDAFYYMWKERRLPSNVDPLKSELQNAEDRKRLAKVFEHGLDKVIGYTLPLAKKGEKWATAPWFFRAGHMFLIPGDSPIGLRLPLDSLPWVPPADYPHLYPPDPLQKLPPLPPRLDGHAALAPVTVAGSKALTETAKASLEPVPAEPLVIRTALCVEPRHGRLYIFMPPVEIVEDYLELLGAIEKTATSTRMPVVIEGTPPPSDPRLDHFKVTPDPGVIEVNLQPSMNWDQLVKNTTVLYEEARLTRLGTEKFMMDGRHVGTGGGNHLVIGGSTPADSPFLRRPDLLRSLVGYWQNHPSLSFLFSGLFIGPTSQHPRVDEARNDSLYELEIAFQQIPEHGNVPPWLVDRVFRNLLIDTTGNTHRAEFCIDKLYSPDGPSGRHGLVELRAFEMPPHSRMSLTQQLLLRALVAWFWRVPYHQSLVRWGTELHDRFMLPHFVREDFKDVVSDLASAGYPIAEEWFDPHFEFRFPVYGSIVQRGIALELRQALEPWHVLGEEGAAGGAVRYVDSSVERLQVKVTGLTESRHYIVCNGRRSVCRRSRWV
ncbi:MAG: dehydrogenase [Verrucomicrobiales bacterium]|nr:dehydrogenase [Verrucomicrobiales bacterium]